MRGGDADLSPVTDDIQRANYTGPEYTYPDKYSDETDSNADLTWSPGDGICPSTAEFNHCCKSKYNDWEHATSSSSHQEGFDTVQSYLKNFLVLHRDVPPFYQSPPKGVNITGSPNSFLVLRSYLQVKTTQDPDCSQPHKSIEYLQCLGSPTPATYKAKSETQLQALLPVHTTSLWSGHFTSLVLAWSYVVSCRWAEILQQAGEKSEIQHEKGMRIEDSFWDIITQRRWTAIIKKRRGIFYSPWMLTDESTGKTREDYVPITPNPSLAFNILLQFCISEGLEYELLTALASVLLLTSRNVPAPWLAPPRCPTAVANPQPQHRKEVFYELLNTVDKCITLSSTQDALDSLACGAFFDPSIPCNLMGAASLGIKGALSTENKIDNRKLLHAITYTQPQLTILWAAIVRLDLVTPYLNMAFHGLPPICLSAGFWTGTVQSFLQVSYHADRDISEKAAIPRVHEFQTSFYCRPGISVPWSPSPPFGQTLIDNVSLEIRPHLGHMHTPLSWITHWVLGSGEKIPATEWHAVRHSQIYKMYQHPCSEAHPNDVPYPEQRAADEQSGMATSRLFNWHRSYDDGIWLDDGTRDTDQIRQLQSHPWIIDPFHETERDEAVEDTAPRELGVENILRWNNEVQQCTRSEESIEP